MYLKSIEVHGFKSFANKLIFEFHNGITAIVGPNGSGKSNVADAVRWVLGEQSAKQLRGSKMEDVIFSGTEMRKPLGYAYVALTINNEDHKLNVPYEEVKIARRVYRSGESEYLLNGAACRLKDVQELLLDTGIGKEGYSIIGQGQIDKILSGKPEDRRELFDEAAGIVKFKKRKAASEKNLEEERQNLTRIEDILSELEKQVGPLAEQSEKAKAYLAYRDELKNLDIHLFLSEYDAIHKEMDHITESREIASHELSEAEKEFDKTKEEYEKASAEIEKCSGKLEEQKEMLSADKLAYSRAEGDIAIFKEQILTLKQNKEHSAEIVNSLKGRLQTAEEEKQGFLEEKEAADSAHTELLSRQEEYEKKIGQAEEKLAGVTAEIENCRNDILVFLNDNTEVKTEEQRIKTLLEQNRIRKAEITKKVLENKTLAAEYTEILEKQKEVLEDASEKIAAVEASIEELLHSEKMLEKKNYDLEMEHRKVQKQYHIENSRLESLRNIAERYEGYGQSTKRIMEQKKDYPGIIGVVADILRVNKEYEVAVEIALGGSIRNIVTDDENTAKAMIEFLKKNRYGRATFLPLTNIKGKKMNVSGGLLNEKGVVGLASTLVQADERFSELVEYLLGKFVVVDHIDHAIALSKKYHHTLRIVTKDGELLSPGGSMSGGAFKSNHNLLGRRREMEEVEEQAKKSKETLEKIRSEIQENEKQKEGIGEKVAANRKVRQELGLNQNTAKLQYDRAKEDLEKNEEDLDLIRLEKTEIDEKENALTDDIEKVKLQMQNNETESEKRKERIGELEKEEAGLKENMASLQQEHAELLLEINSKEQEVGFVQENLNRTMQNITDLKAELEEADGSAENADDEVLLKEKEIEDTEKRRREIEKHISELEESIRKITEEKEQLTQLNKGFFEKREELSEHKANLDKECYRLNGQLEKQKELLDAKTNYMWEQYELTYHAAEESKTPIKIPVSELKPEIARLKNQMKGLGDVNMNAIEQYKEVQERYEHLNTQHDDLIEAAEVLVGIIEDLDAEMRKQFESQFAEIKSRFDKVFKELFGGGRGTLELMEDEDILEAGIHIVAQPPGKKLQNMMQLSGGEKALTAISLLFAIQSLKPSPFCLLDEIEAALDDSNVDRYAQYLHKLTKDTQFIVITHRRGTMNAADILYGITMQEKGVSTLVSVNLLDQDEIVE